MRIRYPDDEGGLKKLRTGKLVAQGSHASMAWLSHRVRDRRIAFSREEQEWLSGKFTKICLYVDTEEELLDIFHRAEDAGLTVHLITDAGLTEFNGVPTKTCLAIGPHESSKIDAITSDLKLL